MNTRGKIIGDNNVGDTNIRDTNGRETQNKMFVPFSEDLLAAAGSPLGELVPYQMEYRCVRLLDGTYDFSWIEDPKPALQSATGLGHAA